MLKTLTLAAFALTSVAAFAQENWSSIDPASASSTDLKKFVVKHAYRTMSAGDAYVLASFLERIPSNAEHALLMGLAQNSIQAKMIRDENQTWANSQPPMGDMMTDQHRDWSTQNMAMDSSRPMRMFAASPKRDLNYFDSLSIVSSGLDAIDQGLIWNLFEPKPYTMSQLPEVNNERELDAVTHYIQANARWTEPYRLKYTSLAPRSW